MYVASAAFGICAVALAGDRIKYGAYLLLFIFILIFVGIKYMKEFSQHAHSMAVKPEKNTEQIDSLAEDNPENNKDQTI